ncbi:MAG: anaerobic ribonucleoside-triphosphate reductase [Methanothrix sp.]
MPRVRTTDGHLLDWDREAIAKQLLKETKLSEQFYKEPGITEEEAKDIAKEVERRVRWMNVRYLSGPLVREIMNVVLLERHHTEWRNICTRVGTPVFDAHLIDIGTGFEAKENANLQENAETSHKKKADKISKEQYLLLLPPYLADRHLAGDLHIHDLEYFGTRPFCLDGSTEITVHGNIEAIIRQSNFTIATKAKANGISIRLDAIQFGELDVVRAPDNLSVLTPNGYRRILKATRRVAGPAEVLRIQTESGKCILATKEHRIPVKTANGMEIRLAGELSAGDKLFSAADFSHIDLKDLDFSAGDETISRIEPITPTGKYVYDLFIEDDGTNESHTFFTTGGLLVHNCQDWDLRYFFYYGLMPDGLGTKASVAGPAKKSEVAILHAVKALGSAQTNFAGGQGFYNFLTFIAPYFEGKPYEEIKQLMQMFVYEMTQMMVARGGQLVFSSVQLTPGVPKLWRDKPAVYSGRVWNGSQPDAPLKTYGQFEREVRLSFKALMEVMLGGDYWGKPFNFPKPEISIEPDFMKEDLAFNEAHPDLPTYQDLYLLTFKLAAEYGTPYFDNQLPAYRGAGEGISCYQCCAYQFAATAESDSQFDDKLYFKDGMHFSMGSWQVVSLNCPRAAYLARGDDELLFEYLRELMDTSVEIFKVKREWMNQIIKNHRMPFATQQPRDPVTGEKGSIAVGLEGLVYTIGVVGVNEMVQFHTGKQMHESKDAWKLAVRAMTEMEIYSKKLSAQHNMTIALARTPAETTAQRFAVSDLIHEEFREYAEGVVKGDLDAVKKNLQRTRDLPVYYTNGTHLPPGADVTIFERAKLEHVFFPIVDGGNIFHIFMGEATPDPKGLMDFGLRLAKETQIGYFTFTKDMTVCLGCSQVSGGLKDKCPSCGSDEVDHISRITGYLQAVSGWNSAKRQELKDRKRYNELA